MSGNTICQQCFDKQYGIANRVWIDSLGAWGPPGFKQQTIGVTQMNISKTDTIEDIDLSEPGSHNGRELELMLRGVKPMAVFIAEDAVPAEFVGDASFELYVKKGLIAKIAYRNDELCSERRCYCLQNEEWRGKLSNFIFRLSCEGDLTVVFTPDDRAKIEGFLLGYTKEAIDRHIINLEKHYNPQKDDKSL